jgi:serine protease Do
MLETQPKPKNGILWLLGGVLLLFLFGCMVLAGVGYYLFSNGSAARSEGMLRPARPIETAAKSVLASQAAPTPSALVVIATPEGGLDYESAMLINIYQQVNPSVVNVTILGSVDELMPGQVPSDTPADQLVPLGNGSGFVWDAAGHIVTNYHVVDQAKQVQVTFSDGAVAVAEVVGTDVDSDLAVLKIDPAGYTLVPVRRGNVDALKVGMRVAAIGNPFGLEGTLTSGIVSALGRSIPSQHGSFSIPDSIQTDAPINPGNSGGPLLNEQGEVIGVNAQIRSDERANSGVGFAIPVTIVERVAPALIADGHYAHSYLGVAGEPVSPICAESLDLPKSLRGAYVSQIIPGGPAARAGLQGGDSPSDTPYHGICPRNKGGDVILAIDDQPIAAFDDVLVYLERYTSPGDQVTLQVLRDGKEYLLDVKLGTRPE